MSDDNMSVYWHRVHLSEDLPCDIIIMVAADQPGTSVVAYLKDHPDTLVALSFDGVFRRVVPRP